jgi:hypothetical protein
LGNSIHRHNPKGNGYYTLKERKWEIGTFLFSSDSLDSARGSRHVPSRTQLELLRTYEYWDIHKLEALVNVNLSEFWIRACTWACRRTR